MKAETRAENALAVAKWYGTALMFPQKNPLELDDIAAYEQRYGAKPNSPITTPWAYLSGYGDPAEVTPMTWVEPVTCLPNQFYDPRDGKIHDQGEQPPNNLDPTSTTFVEPPEIV